jgi:two-component system, NtrC family, response regulator
VAERILVVDDERLTRETLSERLRDEGYETKAVSGGYEALEYLDSNEVDLVLTDLRMPSMDGSAFHRRVRERSPELPVVFMTAFGTVDSAVEAMREGAADYLTKPLNTEELLIRVRRILSRSRDREEIRRLRRSAEHRTSFGDLVYRSQAMREVVERAMAVADTDIAVLVQGETGTGKEVLARAIHAHSQRSDGPFVAVNCAGLNPNLVESELFGHEAGAFTGATRRRKGRFEVSNRGTLLIDEVDDLPPETQVRLLRCLQEHTFERVGSSTPIATDVRVICATKNDLSDLVAEGSFRQDLFYRVNSVVIELPPLRERVDDIPPLASLFCGQARGGEPCDADAWTTDAMGALLSHSWPGNVRELKHAVEHAVAFAGDGLIGVDHLPDSLRRGGPASPLELNLPAEGAVSMIELIGECERRLIDWALLRAGGNQARAAELLSIPRTTLRSRMSALEKDAQPGPPGGNGGSGSTG